MITASRLDLERERIAERFTRHERAALHFSGGKDSLACLFLLRPWWDRIIVTWCNTGDAFPETEALVRKVQAAVPHFREVRSYVRPYIELAGWPVDALPVGHTEHLDSGPRLNRKKRPLMHLYRACCYQNIWVPLANATVEIGASLIFVGSRLSDVDGQPRLRPGTVYLGVEHQMPIWEWSDSDVWAFLEAEAVELPSHFKLAPKTTSLDCMHCTVWSRVPAPERLLFLRERHSEAFREVLRRLQVIRVGVARELEDLDGVLLRAGDGVETATADRVDPGAVTAPEGAPAAPR